MTKKKKIIYAFLGLLAIAFIFDAIVFWAGMKTDFIHRWGGNQYFGEIVEIADVSLVICDRDNNRKTILVSEKTIFKKGRQTAERNFPEGTRVMVFGDLHPSGQVEARLIRIFDQDEPKSGRKIWPFGGSE